MNYMNEYNKWLSSDVVDSETKEQLRSLDQKEIEDAFYRSLEFGTGGLRGVMGAGTNRMNIYTVRKATQGLASYICSLGKEDMQKGVAIAFDSRNNSSLFASECAKVLSANGIKNYMFDSLRPTPELSFAVRYHGCSAGIVITASHNPKEYNGYKVYGDDGGQIPPEKADIILNYIENTDIFDDVKITSSPDTVIIGEETDSAYIECIKAESLGTSIPEDFSVVYTPLHGSGNIPVRRILSEIGVKNVYVVESQELPDGNFPTVKSPNPENKEAFDIAIEYAKQKNADIIFGTDPDSDRIGVVVKGSDGEYSVLSGNQTGVILCEYILRKASEKAKLCNAKVVKTIVTTEMVRTVAAAYGVETVDVLTGFKYIGDKIKEYEADGSRYMFGLEESYGYLKGSYARDKDAVVAAMLVCEVAAECRAEGITLAERLDNLYKKYGYYNEKLLNFTFKGIEGAQKIKDIMAVFRSLEPLDNEVKRLDYSEGLDGLPKSDVLKYILTDGWFAVRPSGTEPKIKFYIAAKADTIDECNAKIEKLSKMIEAKI